MPTTTKPSTLAAELDRASPGDVSDALRMVGLGRLLDPVKVTVAGLTAAAAVDVTAIPRALVTINQGLKGLAAGEALPAILAVTALRVTAVGAGALGPRVATDVGGTPGAPGATGPGIATISDDGKTLTFEGTITGFVLEYIPRSKVDFATAFAPDPKP